MKLEETIAKLKVIETKKYELTDKTTVKKVKILQE